MAPLEELRAQALTWLGRREYGVEELRRRLVHSGGPAEVVGELLEQLQQDGLLSDQRATEAIVRASCRRYGSLRVEQALCQRGLPRVLIEEALDAVRHEELERARQVLARKFAEPPRSRREQAQQARFLTQRGFSAQVIQRLVLTADEGAED